MTPDQASTPVSRLRHPEFGLLRRSADADPYATFSVLRQQGPMVRSALGYWLVTGHEACNALLSDERVGALSELSQRPDVAGGEYPTLELFNRAWLLFNDPPQHGITRGVLAQHLGPAIRAAVEDTIPRVTRDVLAHVDWAKPIDIIATIARPLPVRVLGRILGIPDRDLDWVTRRAVVMTEMIEPFTGATRLRRAEYAASELRQYFAIRAREEPAGSPLRALLASSELEAEVGVANAAFLAASGHETTANFIGMSVLALLSDGDARGAVSVQPTSMHRTVEELLRFTSPIQLVARRVTTPFTYGGQRFERDSILLLFLAAANRDPVVFRNPEALELERSPNPHLAFSTGTHTCFGAALARTEGRELLTALSPRLASLEVERDSIAWRRKRTARGLDRLVVTPRGSEGA